MLMAGMHAWPYAILRIPLRRRAWVASKDSDELVEPGVQNGMPRDDTGSKRTGGCEVGKRLYFWTWSIASTHWMPATAASRRYASPGSSSASTAHLKTCLTRAI